MSAEIKYEDIKILAAEEIELETQPGLKKALVVCTYQWRDFPPRTIWIPKAEYTRAGITKAVQADLKSVFQPPKPL